MSTKGRLPDYAVHAMNKDTDEKARVGGAWINDDGSIAIRLDNFVHLIGSKSLVITLFSNDRRPAQQSSNHSVTDSDDTPSPF